MAQQRIFMTGASGYIGSTIIEQALPLGYVIVGLSRSDRSDEKLRKLGATPVRGNLQSFDVLRDQSAEADIVIHLADSWLENQDKDYSEVVRIDNAVVDAIGSGLEGSNKPLVVTSGSMVVAASGTDTDETSTLDPNPINDRIKCEQHALRLAQRGIKVSAIRLAPFVYGRAASGVGMLLQMFMKAGEVTYIGDGATLTSTIHVEDAAQLFLKAATHAVGGEVFNGVSSHNVVIRDIMQAMAKVLHLPLRSISYEDAVASCGPIFARFLVTENRASGAKARRLLDWNPRAHDIISEITSGSYATGPRSA